jgi:Protein of unknown function, DUF547
MKIKKIILLFPVVAILLSPVVKATEPMDSSDQYILISQSFLYAVKTGEAVNGYQQQLQQADPGILYRQLSDDNKKIAFWLNVYNASVQLLLKENPGKYKKRGQFFGARQIIIAGQEISLDRIEHGILRHSKIKWSLGYFNKLFPGSFEKKTRVQHPDYRIHFALNCGAKSCPPVAFYDPAKIDRQLELATRNYLKNEVEYEAKSNTVRLPAIMSWFRRDFGGKKKMNLLLKEMSIIPGDTDPVIHFKKYDWTLFLSNYKTENDD